MDSSIQQCTLCGVDFVVKFAYQVQRSGEEIHYFCSQKCHERSLYQQTLNSCSACGTRFHLVYAYQQAMVRDEKLAFCSSQCRAKVLEGAGAAQHPSTTKAHRIAVLNQKGGTGKTTTAVSLASGLATMGYRTLIMDVDSQGSVGVSLGTSGQKTLYHVLLGAVSPQEAAVRARERLDLISANETLAMAEIRLAQMTQGRDRVLSYRMRGMKAYDYVILDCGPSLNLLNQNALVYADQVLIPVSCDYLSLVGVKQILKTLKMVNDILKHPITILGVLPTFYDQRNKICHEAVSTMKKYFKEKVLPPIRVNTRLKEAPSYQKTIFEYDSESRGAQDYLGLVKWLIAKNAGLEGITPQTDLSPQDPDEPDDGMKAHKVQEQACASG